MAAGGRGRTQRRCPSALRAVACTTALAFFSLPPSAAGNPAAGVFRRERPVDHPACAASTGAQLIAALAESAGCVTILLDGVVTLHDGDFPGNANVLRTSNVTLTSAWAGHSGGRGDPSAARHPWATLETSVLLTRHIDVPAGVTVTMANLYIAGGSRLVEGEMEAERPFSAFSLADGAAAVVVGSDVRLAPESCEHWDGSAADQDWLVQVEAGGGGGGGGGDSDGDSGGGGGEDGVAVRSATIPVDAIHLSAAPAAASAAPAAARARPAAAKVFLRDTTLWCAPAEAGVLAGDAGGAVAVRAASLVTARVWTGPELAFALGRTGSRTIVVSSDRLTLPPPVTGALNGPEALIQDREIVVRGRRDAGGRAAAAPARILIPLAPPAGPAPGPGDGHRHHHQCKQPLVRAGQGGSVAFAGLTLAARDPGCALPLPGPDPVCSLNGAERPFPHALRGSLLPSGMAGVEPGGSLAFEGVAIEYEECTPALAAAAVATAGGAGGEGKARLVAVSAGGAVLVLTDAPPGGGGALPAGYDPAGLVLTCTVCVWTCHRADVDFPMQVALTNVTLACGAAARRMVAGSGGRRAGGGPPFGRPVGLATGGGGAARASMHSSAVVALGATMGVAACLAVAAAVAAGLTVAGNRRAARAAAVAGEGGTGGGGAGGATAAPATAALPTGHDAAAAAGTAGPSNDNDSAHGATMAPGRRRGRRGWVAKLVGAAGGERDEEDDKPPPPPADGGEAG